MSSNNEEVHIVAGVVLKDGQKFLLVQEKKKKAYGLWNLPAGRVEPGASLEETAVREAKEETGYDVIVERELGVFKGKTESVEKHSFAAKIVGGELKMPEEELLDVCWFTADEIIEMEKAGKLRGDGWVSKSVEILLNR